MTTSDKKVTFGLVNVFGFQKNATQSFELDADYDSTLIFNGENGAGKSVIMTMLQPEPFVFDLQRSINLGTRTRNGRKISHYFNDEQSYIYAKTTIYKKPMTFVTCYRLAANNEVKKSAFIIESHDVAFTDENDNSLPLQVFRQQFKSKRILSKEYTSGSAYRKTVADILYNIDAELYERFITTTYTIANPQIDSLKRAKVTNANSEIDETKVGTFSVDTFQQTVLSQLPSVTQFEIKSAIDDSSKTFGCELKTNIQKLIDAHESRMLVDDYRRKLLYLAKEREKNTKKNIKHLEDIDRELNRLKRDIENSEKRLEKYEAQVNESDLELVENETKIGKLETSIDEDFKQKADIEKAMATVDSEIKQLETSITSLKNQIKTTDDEKDSAEVKLKNAKGELKSYTYELRDHQEKLDELVEPIKPSFSIKDDWPEIQEAFKTERENQKELDANINKLKTVVASIDENSSQKDTTSRKLESTIESYRNQSSDSDEITNLSDVAPKIDQFNKSIIQLGVDSAQQTTKRNELQSELNDAQNNTKPKTSFVADDPKPLYELVEDFEGFVSEDDRIIIENLMNKAGITETLVSAENIKEGIYLC